LDRVEDGFCSSSIPWQQGRFGEEPSRRSAAETSHATRTRRFRTLDFTQPASGKSGRTARKIGITDASDSKRFEDNLSIENWGHKEALKNAWGGLRQMQRFRRNPWPISLDQGFLRRECYSIFRRRTGRRVPPWPPRYKELICDSIKETSTCGRPSRLPNNPRPTGKVKGIYRKIKGSRENVDRE